MNEDHRLQSRPGWQPHRLREARQYYGLSLEKACRQVQKAARRRGMSVPGISPSMMWKHENGKVYPSQTYQDLYTATYGASEAALGFRLPLPGESDDAPFIIGSSAVPVPHSSNINSTPGNELENRLAMALHQSIRFSAYADTANVGLEAVPQILAETRRIAELYTRQATITIIGDIVELQSVTFALTEASSNPRQKRDLYFLGGVISGLLAEASEDLGNFAASRIHGRTAYLCAENADSNALRAWARFQQMLTAYWSGVPEEVIRLADASRDLLRHVTGLGGSRLLAVEARAWGALGNSQAAEEAINRSLDTRERAVPDEVDGLGGQVAYPLWRQLWHNTNALTWLSEHMARAEQSAIEALAAYANSAISERSYIPEACCRADLATARILSGNLDGAREAMEPVLGLPSSQRSGSIRSSLLRAHSALRASRYMQVAAARTIRLEIEEFSQFGARAGLT
jgi:hypothetical protein